MTTMSNSAMMGPQHYLPASVLALNPDSANDAGKVSSGPDTPRLVGVLPIGQTHVNAASAASVVGFLNRINYPDIAIFFNAVAHFNGVAALFVN
jgi:hypothetical protein